jgi:hypothetical protein
MITEILSIDGRLVGFKRIFKSMGEEQTDLRSQRQHEERRTEWVFFREFSKDFSARNIQFLTFYERFKSGIKENDLRVIVKI